MTSLFHDIQTAHHRITPHILRTPLTLSRFLSEKLGVEVYLKNEHLQHTGSFKLRGALNKILSLTSEEKQRGVIAASTGNHGLGVAYAASLAGVEATVYVPENASPVKLKAITSWGAKLIRVPGDCLLAELSARRAATQFYQTFISPYNDLTVIAGQGTIGLEISDQGPPMDAVFVSVGGGGLISGIATYLSEVSPGISVVGCWPENSPVMMEALKAGRVIPVEERPTLSDATAGGIEENCVTLPLCQKLIHEQILVTEQEIQNAIREIAEHEHWMIEGSAGVALASLMKNSDRYKGKRVAVVLCGRNIALGKFNEVIS